jgi:hypothetical protein
MHQPRRISISRPAERCTDWANTANPQGQVTQETFGNGLVVNHAFDAVTGWLGTITAGAGGGSALQNNSYLFDYVGNLTQRQDNNPGAHRERLSRCAQPQIRALADGRRARHGGEPSSRPSYSGSSAEVELLLPSRRVRSWSEAASPKVGSPNPSMT